MKKVLVGLTKCDIYFVFITVVYFLWRVTIFLRRM